MLCTGNPAQRFGAMLEAKGFARHGQEKLISGITGEEMVGLGQGDVAKLAKYVELRRGGGW